jgi:hypothetical protein
MQRQHLDDWLALYRGQNSPKEAFEQIILLVR